MSCTPRGGSGDVVFANPTAAVELVPINGSAVTAMRSDAAPRLNEAITPVWTGQHQFNAWPKISGNPPAIEYDDTGSGLSCLAYAGTGSPEGVIAGNVGSTYRDLTGTPGATYYIKESSPTLTTGWVPVVSGGGLGNPTQMIGLAAVNGVATTGIRSDGAPALDQSISPSWTAAHYFLDKAWFKAGQSNQIGQPRFNYQSVRSAAGISSNGPVTLAGINFQANSLTPFQADGGFYVESFGTFAANGNAKDLFYALSANTLFSITTTEQGNWHLQASHFYSVAAGDLIYLIRYTDATGLVQMTQGVLAGVDWTIDNNLQMGANAALNDIILHAMQLEFLA